MLFPSNTSLPEWVGVKTREREPRAGFSSAFGVPLSVFSAFMLCYAISLLPPLYDR